MFDCAALDPAVFTSLPSNFTSVFHEPHLALTAHVEQSMCHLYRGVCELEGFLIFELV